MTDSRTPSFGPSALATPANALSAARIAATPLVIALIVIRGASALTLAVWIVLASTDWVDGWVARRQGTTRSGAFLDPLADKFLVLGALATIAGIGGMPWLPIVLIAVREVIISGYRSWVGRRGVSVPASKPAKVKTLVQDIAITLALIAPIANHHRWVVTVAVWVAAALTVGTGIHYAWVLGRAARGSRGGVVALEDGGGSRRAA